LKLENKKMKKCIVIAEAGVNHNGSIVLAKKLVDIAVRSGADFIKFQSFKAHSVVTKKVAITKYQKINQGKSSSQYEMIKKLELSYLDHLKIIKYCKKKKINFLSTAFDLESMKMLIQFKPKFIKIASGDINNVPLLKYASSFKIPIIFSTGMSNLKEINTAIKILLKNGLTKNKITILQCNTEYPTPFEDVNLRAMIEIKKRTKLKVGYSDHTKGLEAAIGAVTLGACIIEKHFTISNKLKGPDHRASLEPDELKKLVTSIRNIEKAMGSKLKKITKSEKKNIKLIRRSIVAKIKINIGDVFSYDNLTVKRPAYGMSPLKWEEIIGKKSKKNFNIDDFIK
jgi:N,N'-diacetyllegionaminate synthase